MIDILEKDYEKTIFQFEKLLNTSGDLKVSEARESMQNIMQQHAAIFKDHETLTQGINKMAKLEKIVSSNLKIHDNSMIFNTNLVEALELFNLITLSKATLHSALQRRESRGAHIREDFKERDDAKFLKHTLYSKTSETYKISYKTVKMSTIPNKNLEPIKPEIRQY